MHIAKKNKIDLITFLDAVLWIHPLGRLTTSIQMREKKAANKDILLEAGCKANQVTNDIQTFLISRDSFRHNLHFIFCFSNDALSLQILQSLLNSSRSTYYFKGLYVCRV